jgi:hypothetical protein
VTKDDAAITSQSQQPEGQHPDVSPMQDQTIADQESGLPIPVEQVPALGNFYFFTDAVAMLARVFVSCKCFKST